jgi:multicomponent Na+:H+ antiporter subunit D
MQRHVKRLLAFSTISHVGIFVTALALLTHQALAGLALYIVGHGLTKGALFMCAGVLLHRFATIDEYDLHGRGRELPFVGVLFALGALLLAAVPPFTAFAGKSLIEVAASERGYGWLIAVFVLVSALTGGAVLRVAGRVFLGWGPPEGPDPNQARAARERVDEELGPRDRTPATMVAVPAVLLLGAAVVGLVPGVVPGVERIAARFTDHAAYPVWVLGTGHVSWPQVASSHTDAIDVLYALLALGGALGTAALGLFGAPLRASLPSAVGGPARTALLGLRQLHSGEIGDYIAWWTAGASVLGGVCLLALT